MKRRNADCGKIRRPIKKNKIAEQIGSNTLLYIKFLLLWAFVIIADFLLEFRFEFLWPFWLLLRSIYDSFKYKGLAFSVLFVCIAVTSDLVCLFFIPVQWLFFAASTYVWVQYVWHTDKGICLPTIILWILFVYLEAAIRWKDSRNIPHLNLCRPFAAHCIGYPVVTLGFGFKSYVGYRIRQRKQREVAKDNDFYMQLLQEALPKEESTALLEPALDGASGTDVLAQKELVLVATANNSLNNSSSSTASSKSDTGQHHHHHHNHHHNHHNHHHHNHQQQQQQQSHSKGAQSYKSSSNSTPSGTHVNGHVSSGSSPSSSGSAMNGGLTHASHQQQGSSKHRKSLDKDSNGSNSTAGSSSTLNAGSKMNGSGGGGSYSYHQATTFQQSSGSNATTASNGSSSSGSNSSNGGVTHSTKENTATVNRANDHSGAGGSIHCNGGSMMKDKDSKENIVPGLVGRKDYDKESSSSSLAGSTSSSSTSSSTRNGQTATVTTNRSKSPTENCTGGSSGGTVAGKTTADKQNLSFSDYQQLWVVRQMSTDAPVPAESKGGRSGRKNRLKKAAEQANLSAITKLCATLALASSVTTLTTTGTATSATSGDGGAAVTTSSSSNAGCITSTSANDNHHQHNGEQQEQVASKANVSDNNTVERSANSCNGQGNGTATHHSSGAAESKSATGVSPVSGTLKATQTVNSSGQGSNPAIAPTPVATVVVQKVCESCPRLEGELKKIRSELASHRQMENDMRQKYDATTSNLKGCLQAKQKDFDDLQSRYQEHTNQRQQERQNLQTVERRLGEERRHRQSLEAQLNNERKYRKQAEDKAARSECGESCKMKKQQMEMEIDKLQHELLNMEEAKLMTETQARNIEQEMRKMELQLRSRESQQNTEVLMSALAAMQDKNATLEKNLSAETRVKLDLFSALGGTRREVEILTCSLRTKEKEILDLNAKIVQLVAVMPTMPNDALCLTGHTSGSGVDGVSGGSMMRLPDAPQLLPQPMSSGHLNGVLPGGGPSGGGGGMQQSGQQSSSLSHMVQNGPPFCSQLGSLGVLTSTMTTLSSSSVMSGPNAGSANNCGVVGLSSLSGSGGGGVSVSGGGQIVQMQNSNNGSNGNCPSNLDPNATIYTPKNNGMVGGTEA